MIEDIDEKGLQDYLGILKRNKNKMLLIGGLAFILTVFIALKWPATYKSTATILIEQQEIPQDLVRSTVTTFADQRIQVISQRVMGSVNLNKIIEKYQLYQEKKTEHNSVVVNNMRQKINLSMISADVVDPISGRPIQATIAFTLSFESKSAKKAQQVTNELVNLYLNENLKRRSEIATEATSFLAIEANKLSKVITDLEAKLAVFKERNESSLPELQQLNVSLMDRTEQQLLEMKRELSSSEDRIVYLEAQLTQVEPNLFAFSETGQGIYSSQGRLKTLQSQYISLKAKYAENHPDVIKMQKEISALEDGVGGVDKLEMLKQLKSKQGEFAALSERYSEGHPDLKNLRQQIKQLQLDLEKPGMVKKQLNIKPDNPAYIQLLTQLNVVETKLLATTELKDKLESKLKGFEISLLKAPQVEREYRGLMREYENTSQKYREVKSKQMEADIAQAMEKDRKAERFSLVEPPILPDKPFKPNREAIVFLGLILSIGLAIAFAIFKELLNPLIYGKRGLLSVTGELPLVVIPYIENEDDLLKLKKTKHKMIFILFALIIIMVAGVHWLIKPLDVLWYIMMRKSGLN